MQFLCGIVRGFPDPESRHAMDMFPPRPQLESLHEAALRTFGEGHSQLKAVGGGGPRDTHLLTPISSDSPLGPHCTEVSLTPQEPDSPPPSCVSLVSDGLDLKQTLSGRFWKSAGQW